VQELLKGGGGGGGEEHGLDRLSYEEVARACFEEMASLGDDEAIVLKVCERLSGAV